MRKHVDRCKGIWLLGLTWLLASAGPVSIAAQSPFAILQSSSKGRGFALNWSDLGPGSGYVVEVRNMFSGGDWMPAPASVWPLNVAAWQDQRLLGSGAEFYRVMTTPA